jgi:hypothetical protein
MCGFCRPKAGAGVFENSSFKRHDGIILAGIGTRFAAKHSLEPKFDLITFSPSIQQREHHVVYYLFPESLLLDERLIGVVPRSSVLLQAINDRCRAS